jgi:hypothetical protein
MVFCRPYGPLLGLGRFFSFLILYTRHVQLQTGCDRLFSVKTASDLPPPPIVVPRFKAKILVKITRHMMFVVKATYIESTDYFNKIFNFKI